MPLSPASGAGRPRRVGLTLLIVAALAVLIGLGTWQVMRLQEKAALLDRIDTRLVEATVPLPAAVVDPTAWDYRRVEVTGTFLGDREMRVLGRIRHGRSGAHVVTPLRRADGTTVLVNRGWVPDDWQGPPADTGPMTVTGIARVPSPPGWMVLDNVPETGTWFSVSIPEMARALDLDRVAPVVVEAGPTPSGTLPEGGITRVDIPNNHLEYAITWYALAGALLAMFLIHRRRRP